MVEQGSEIKDVFFIVSGCLNGSLFDRLGKELVRDTFRRGTVVGLFSVLLPDRSYLHVEAAESSTVLLLTLDELLGLTARHRDFQLAMFRISANIVKRLVMVDRNLPKPPIVGVVHFSDGSRSLTRALAERPKQLEESPCIAGDDDRWKPVDGIPHRLLYENGIAIGPDQINQLLKEWATRGRMLIDVRADHSPEDLNRIFGYCDIVLWCVQPDDADRALQTLKAAESAVPRLREKIGLVWVLDNDNPGPPYVQELQGLAVRDFKVYSGESKSGQGKLLRQGIERIVHYLRGVQIGLALGGGAARGMAHMGVLKALEQHVDSELQYECRGCRAGRLRDFTRCHSV